MLNDRASKAPSPWLEYLSSNIANDQIKKVVLYKQDPDNFRKMTLQFINLLEIPLGVIPSCEGCRNIGERSL